MSCKETICINVKSYFLGKIRKICSSTEFDHRVIKVKKDSGVALIRGKNMIYQYTRLKV